mgnify:FL=1|jgi:hypothetical protein
MRKKIYVLTIECSYQNINKNKVGKRVVSKNKNYITIHSVFTENTIEGLHSCERCMDRIKFHIRKKHKKDVEIKVDKILDSLPVGMSNDIY